MKSYDQLIFPAIGCFGIGYLLFQVWCTLRPSTLRNKVVLITGASSGIGEACAHKFYEVGANLILCARRVSELQRVKKELEALKVKNAGSVNIVAVDLGDLDNISRYAEEALKVHGHVDVLVNNAGMSLHGGFLNTSIEAEMKLFKVNVFGTVAFTRAILPSMIERKSGHILVVSSVQAYFAIPNRSCYAASKHAIMAYFDSLRSEVSHHGISVTIFNPSYVKTNLSYNSLTESGNFYNKQSPEYLTAMSGEYCAHQIERAITCQRKEVALGPLLHRFVIYLRRLCPTIFYIAMERRAAKERKLAEKNK